MGEAAQTTAADALSEEWLARTDKTYDFYVALRDRFEPGRPVWITETADAACGGNPWAKTFLDSFRYADQLGRLAKRGVAVVFHNTLASSESGLIDQDSFQPRPNYWTALLWRRMMGTTVLDAAATSAAFHVYAHCLRDHPGGVAILAINTNRTRPQTLDLAAAGERYTLTASELKSEEVRLNGRLLKLGAADEIPSLVGAKTVAGPVAFAPGSITFVAVPDAGNERCR